MLDLRSLQVRLTLNFSFNRNLTASGTWVEPNLRHSVDNTRLPSSWCTIMSPLSVTSDRTGRGIMSDMPVEATDTQRDLAEARAEVSRLTAEYEDLKLLYQAMIEHGEAVEDQLAESNILLEKTQVRLQEELEDAARYVHSLLPEQRSDDPKTDYLLVPSTELGGDSFGYHDIDDSHFAIYLLDVCGHGVGAALLSATIINVLRAAALPDTEFRDPGSVLASLNDAFPMEKQNNMFFTIWYGVYNRQDQTLKYSSGGHPPAILIRRQADGSMSSKALPGDGHMVMGAMAGMEYGNETARMLPNDILIVVSDGTFEIVSPDGGLMSFQDLVDFTAGADGDRPQVILDWVRSVNGADILPDDFSLLRIGF